MAPITVAITWHPRTEVPTRAWAPAIIAVPCDPYVVGDPALIILPSLYSFRSGQWETELDGKPLVAPEGFWWAAESDLVGPLACLLRAPEPLHG